MRLDFRPQLMQIRARCDLLRQTFELTVTDFAVYLVILMGNKNAINDFTDLFVSRRHIFVISFTSL